MSELPLNSLRHNLDIQDIDFRAAQIYEHGDNVYCSVLAYKDARVDMHRLDDVVGPENWQNEFKRDSKGILQGGIGIKCGNEWVWKWSNGTPSDFEKEKGEYSDALKRAGFMWGIGRELYDYPQIKVILNDNEYYTKDGKKRVSGYFKPNNWKWLLDWQHPETGGFKLVAYQYFGNTKTLRYDSNPYNSKNQRT